MKSGFSPRAVVKVVDWECEEMLEVEVRMFLESCFVGFGSVGREMDLVDFGAFCIIPVAVGWFVGGGCRSCGVALCVRAWWRSDW